MRGQEITQGPLCLSLQLDNSGSPGDKSTLTWRMSRSQEDTDSSAYLQKSVNTRRREQASPCQRHFSGSRQRVLPILYSPNTHILSNRLLPSARLLSAGNPRQMPGATPGWLRPGPRSATAHTAHTDTHQAGRTQMLRSKAGSLPEPQRPQMS